MRVRYVAFLLIGSAIGGYLAHVATTDTPHVRAGDAKVEKIDRLEITDPKGNVTVVIHSDPKPTVEVADDKGKVTSMDLRDLARLSKRFGQQE